MIILDVKDRFYFFGTRICKKNPFKFFYATGEKKNFFFHAFENNAKWKVTPFFMTVRDAQMSLEIFGEINWKL